MPAAPAVLAGPELPHQPDRLGEISGLAPETAPRDPADLTDPRFEWAMLLGPSCFIAGLVSTVLVFALVVVLPALAVSLLRTGPITPWLMLAAG